uniref:Serine protease family S01B putative n=1 Tax=Albugo laibachii Nc14 TaxID=890382 RepID=F0W0N2_9STRA|nr:serine protease family S01B putative [Albugo laibachii Nc14]|eukprot:CCA14604.1 serine protease family S01B putative [Albugo laibachii Nc14]
MTTYADAPVKLRRSFSAGRCFYRDSKLGFAASLPPFLDKSVKNVVVESAKIDPIQIGSQKALLGSFIRSKCVFASNICRHCFDRFSFLRRPHRCRRCGVNFCHKCSKYKMSLPGHTLKSRVCKLCFDAGNTDLRDVALSNTWFSRNSAIPSVILNHVMSYLDPIDVVSVSMTCQYLHVQASSDVVWKPLYYERFNHGENIEKKSTLEYSSSSQQDLRGIKHEALSWSKKYAIRQSTQQLSRNFRVMTTLLGSLGLSRYTSTFEEEEIDIESLCLMNAGHLRDLGIPVGPRMMLLNAAACLVDLRDDENENDSSYFSTSQCKQKRAESREYRASLVRRVQQSVVRIAILTLKGELCNVGSGIIVHASGLIATACHCLQGENFDCIQSDQFIILVGLTESTSSPPLWKYHATAIPECCNTVLDYALIRIDYEVVSDPPSGVFIGPITDRIISSKWNVIRIEGSCAKTIGPLPAIRLGDSDKVEPGEEMWMFGYPSSGHNTITVHHAICSGTDSQSYNGKELDKAMLRTAAQLDDGFSGGPAVNTRGQLLGLISFSVLRQDRMRAINLVKEAIDIARKMYCVEH